MCFLIITCITVTPSIDLQVLSCPLPQCSVGVVEKTQERNTQINTFPQKRKCLLLESVTKYSKISWTKQLLAITIFQMSELYA
jgi:hypothetical protein